jgi:2-haloacid dehalogenase
VAQSLYHDIAPARALGLATVWVDRQTGRGAGMTPPTDAQPDLRVTSMAELTALHRAEG